MNYIEKYLKSNKPKIYFAGPLFTPGDLMWNQQIVRRIEALGFEVYLPQEAVLIDEASTLEDRKNAQEWDNLAIDNCDLMIAILHGTDIDSGTACEIGRAGYQKKWILGHMEDCRCFARNEQVNTYVEQFISEMSYDETNLMNQLRDFLNDFERKED